jgi:hypothetical protein
MTQKFLIIKKAEQLLVWQLLDCKLQFLSSSFFKRKLNLIRSQKLQKSEPIIKT